MNLKYLPPHIYQQLYRQAVEVLEAKVELGPSEARDN